MRACYPPSSRGLYGVSRSKQLERGGTNVTPWALVGYVDHPFVGGLSFAITINPQTSKSCAEGNNGISAAPLNNSQVTDTLSIRRYCSPRSLYWGMQLGPKTSRLSVTLETSGRYLPCSHSACRKIGGHIQPVSELSLRPSEGVSHAAFT